MKKLFDRLFCPAIIEPPPEDPMFPGGDPARCDAALLFDYLRMPSGKQEHH